MLTIIFAVICLLAAGWILWTMWGEMANSVIGNIIATFMFGLCAVAVAGFLVLGVGALCFWLNDSGPHVTQKWDLQQISHDQGIHGHFYLGSGYINSEQEFVAYYKTEGGYRLGQFPAGKTLVIERDTQAPTLYEYDRYVSGWLVPHFADAYHYKFVIVVPKGSVAPTVNLNLSGVPNG